MGAKLPRMEMSHSLTLFPFLTKHGHESARICQPSGQVCDLAEEKRIGLPFYTAVD